MPRPLPGTAQPFEAPEKTPRRCSAVALLQPRWAITRLLHCISGFALGARHEFWLSLPSRQRLWHLTVDFSRTERAKGGQTATASTCRIRNAKRKGSSCAAECDQRSCLNCSRQLDLQASPWQLGQSHWSIAPLEPCGLASLPSPEWKRRESVLRSGSAQASAQCRSRHGAFERLPKRQSP